MKRVVQVDAETGEMLEGAVLGMFFPKRQNGFNGGWLAMAQDALMALAKADLGDEARRVLFAVLGRLDFENYILLNQAEIAEVIGMLSDLCQSFHDGLRHHQPDGTEYEEWWPGRGRVGDSQLYGE